MRHSHLLTSAALGIIFASAPAFADTTISTATTTPVKSATINSGSADNIDITADGSITLTSGTAITVNSDNTLIMNGTIEMSGAESGATGILIDGARTTKLELAGTITVTDDYTAEDTDDDDIVDGPFAEGTGRYGVRATGLLTGDADISSTITVHGNQSSAIAFENGQVGDFLFDGTISVLGEDSTGIALSGLQTGQVYISGSIGVSGKNSQAVTLSGGIDGALIIDAAISGTGYRYTSISDDYLDLLDEDDLYQNKALVSVSSNVTQGILIGAAITGEDDDNDDENGNGIDDSEESTAALTQYGSAAALLIGSDSKAITIGSIVVNDSAIDPDEINHALDIRGTITSYGLYEGIDATAVQIAGLGYTTTLVNGISLSGSVAATSWEGTARGLSLLSGAEVGRLDLSGALTASTTTTDSDTAYGLDIASGANLSTLTVRTGGSVSAYGYGTTANATAVRDQSNTLSQITVNGAIFASLTAGDEDDDDVTDTLINRPVAIDLSANTIGTTLDLTDLYPDDDDYATPYISGDIKFGSGNDVVNLSGGYIYGNIDFGAGANSLNIDDGGIVIGKLNGAGTVAVDVEDGRLGLAAGSLLNVTSLHLGSEAELYMVLQTASPTSALLVNSGTTTFDNGASIYLSLDKIIQSPTRFTLISGSNINYGNLDLNNLDGNVPWIYKATLATGTGNTNLYADFRLRTQAESGLSVNEYTALSAVLTAAATNSYTTATILNTTVQADFIQAYAAFLPDYSGENLLSLSRGHEALGRTLERQAYLPVNGDTQFWLQEFGYQTSRGRGVTTGFDATGFSFAGGAERAVGAHQATGIYVSYTSTAPKDTYATAYETTTAQDITFGGYWRLQAGDFRGWATAGAGKTLFSSDRQLISSSVALISKSKWDGYSLSGSAGASYRVGLGPISLKPLISVDYYGLKESDRNESGGGTAYDLTIAERTSHIATGSALLYIGRGDKTGLFQPEVWVGYKNNFSVKADDTTASFTGGTPFTLNAGNLKGGAPVLGLRMSAGNEYGYLSLEAEGEKYSDYSNYSLSLRTGFRF
ncbi:autotransporter domain-containing protein [Asticcacaulis sp. BYS171W]|uniref:Autotransporter domain-containing protein n=1 Tax=Asticcacaulis aquaticus TaxID=2984212 RepID=A0ABT5HWY3_9CAUL|nr:autotransporter outer membrane beta-barrel domain-containing protein [Asticcacaulis aquaticus]MDC7684568.1 autotransporter domain-containing protein [Asticcacaulis aquaticus]